MVELWHELVYSDLERLAPRERGRGKGGFGIVFEWRIGGWWEN